MSEVPPPVPPQTPPGGSRGALVFGIVVGVVYIAALVGLTFVGGPLIFETGGLLLIVPLLLYIVAAIVLAAFPRTSNIGAGLAIGMGASLLVGAGVCFALLAAPIGQV